ncbi:cell wall protein [Streptomyces sp. 11x1]|uniref:cell wall protein n=1 Tax=Streptomyces sp. 11x1 TaxID=3038642 RepID=UPI0037DA60C7
MRLCTCLTLALAAAAAIVSGPAAAATVPAPASDALRTGCVGDDSGAFPIRTRIRGGPTTYVAGGGFHTWAVELTNTTSRTCGNIHPVVVLADSARTLKRSQLQLEFYDDADDTTPRPVTFERTDADELVGVLGGDGHGGGTGFTVLPGRTLAVKVRLSLTSDATAPNEVVANAAVVERRGDDGTWVGESNDYRFRITDEEEDEDGTEAGQDSGGAEDEDGTEAGQDSGGAEDEDGTEAGQDGGGAAKERGGTTAVPDERRPYPDELAASGMREALPYVTGLLLLVAGGLLTATVRRRAR